MKIKFKFGIKTFSGTADDMNFAHYKAPDITIGRVVPSSRIVTEQNNLIGGYMQTIAKCWEITIPSYRDDFANYAKKMYRLKPFKDNVGGNGYSVFVKMIWAASKDPSSGIDLETLSPDDFSMGSYEKVSSIKKAVDAGLLLPVRDYELYINSVN